MTRYLSLDIETTGLNPGKDQVLEVGIVLDDLQHPKPIADLPRFHCYVRHPRIIGDPIALAMNAAILNKIANWDKHPEDLFTTPDAFVSAVLKWLEGQGYKLNECGRIKDKVVVAGKNAASFDIPFLRSMTTLERSYPTLNNDEFMYYIHPAHRVIDPAMFYMRIDDEIPPSLPECLRRAGLVTDISHRAVDDAMAVVKLIRNHFGIVDALPVTAGMD